MRYLLVFIFISSKIFSQVITVPVEEKRNYLTNLNYKNYLFKDDNKVLDKFLGKWKYRTDDYNIDLEIFKYFDKDNQQDAIYINVKYLKGDNLIMDTTRFNEANYIYGATFENPQKTNSLIVYFSEISETWNCGHVSLVKLTYKNPNVLIWYIEPKELDFNKTASLLPKEMSFSKQ